MLGFAARQQMVMRADLERDASSAPNRTRDPYGGPVAPSWGRLAAGVPCFVYSVVAAESVTTERTVTLEQLKIRFPQDTDVTERDRVATVKNRVGFTLFPGPFNLRGVQRREGFIEASLQGVSP